MNKLRTIIRLYTDRVGLRAIAEMARTSRNTVKKYVNKWNSLSLSYEDFIAMSDAELYALFCIEDAPGYTTVTEHLCPKHRAVMEWSPERFVEQAAAIHEDVEHYIRRVLEKNRYQDQAIKMCSGILNFARKVGPERLAAACRLADSIGKYNFRKIQDILQNKSEAIDLPEEPADMSEHENQLGEQVQLILCCLYKYLTTT